MHIYTMISIKIFLAVYSTKLLRNFQFELSIQYSAKYLKKKKNAPIKYTLYNPNCY